MKTYKQLQEVLTKSDPVDKWIHDFVHSDNPKFDGKSAAKRKQMALAAYYSKQRDEEVEEQASMDRDLPHYHKTKSTIHSPQAKVGVPSDAPVHGKRPRLSEDVRSSDTKTIEYKGKDGHMHTRKLAGKMIKFDTDKEQQDEGYVSANSAPDIQPQMNEGKMSQIHADIEDHLGKHVANYKKMGGSEHLGSKSVETAKHIAKLHNIPQHHAQKFVNDYVDSNLKESDESWAAAMEKQKKDRLTDKDKSTLSKVAAMMAKEKAKRELDLNIKKAQNSQRVAKALGEAVDKEHPIYKEYQSLKNMSIKDLRDKIKQQHKIVDTSEFRTKEHAASHIINNKHGNKRVKAVFGEESELNEAYRLPSDSEIDKVKAHIKANHPNKSLAQVAVHKQSKKIEYVVKDKEGKMTGHTLGEARLDTTDQAKGLSAHGRHEYDVEHYKDGKISHKTKIISHHPPTWISKIAKHIDKKPGMTYKIVHDETGKVYNVKEETEQIDEISKKTLGSYVKKAAKDRGLAGMEVGALHAKSSLARMKKRLAGIEKATDKLAKEEVEQIDELSLNTLKSAEKKNTDKAYDYHMDDNKHWARKSAMRALNLRAKIAKKERQQTKEEVEQIDELKSSTLQSYSDKAHQQALDYSYDAAHHKDKDDKKQAQFMAQKRAGGVKRAETKLSRMGEQVEESRGHKTIATALANIDRWKRVSFDQPKYTEKGIETPKKDAESKEKKQMVNNEEDEKVYDEKWKKYVGKSFKKATK